MICSAVKLDSELSSLAAKKWKHPISGRSVIFGRSTIQRWYYIALENTKVLLASGYLKDNAMPEFPAPL